MLNYKLSSKSTFPIISFFSLAMFFKTILLSVFLASCLVAAHKKQLSVPANLDCSCVGYQAKAKECKWTDATCSEVANSGFQNYKSWCTPINAFRDAKRFGFTSAEFVRYIPCSIGNLSKEQVTAQRANLKLAEPKTPKYLVPTATDNGVVPFSTAPVTATKTWAQSAVKNQGTCGSCWAFATTGYLEAYTIKNGGAVTVDLSVSFIWIWHFKLENLRSSLKCRNNDLSHAPQTLSAAVVATSKKPWTIWVQLVRQLNLSHHIWLRMALALLA